MRPHETNSEKKRFVLLRKLADQFRRLHRRFAIRMHEVISVRLHHHKRIAAHHRPFAVGIALQRFALARRAPFRAFAVVALVP